MWANMGHDPSDGSAKGGEGLAGVACPSGIAAPPEFGGEGKPRWICNRRCKQPRNARTEGWRKRAWGTDVNPSTAAIGSAIETLTALWAVNPSTTPASGCD